MEGLPNDYQRILQKHKFIVFCIDHYNMLGICRSLGEKGISPIVILVGKKSRLIRHCRYVKQFHLFPTREEGLEFILSKFGNEIDIPFIFTGDDKTTQLLDKHFEELHGRFYFFNCGQKDGITRYMDKATICNVATLNGISPAKSELLRRNEVPKTLKYPIITKVTMSTKGAWKADVNICNNEEELRSAWDSIKADDILAQEFIVKKNELCVDGYSINGGEQVVFVGSSEYIRFTEKGYGNYMWIKPLQDKATRDKICNIIKATHFSGIFELESLIGPNDELYFLEVNFRNSTWSYAYSKVGFNIPYEWAVHTLFNNTNTYDKLQLNFAPVTAMVEIDDYRDSVISKKISIWEWFKDLISSDCKFYWNIKDPMPALRVLTPFFISCLLPIKKKR